MNTYNLKKICAVSVASIMCVSVLAFSGCGDKKAEVSQTPDETTPATTAVSTADEPTAQNYLESIGIDTATLGINPNIIHDSNLIRRHNNATFPRTGTKDRYKLCKPCKIRKV